MTAMSFQSLFVALLLTIPTQAADVVRGSSSRRRLSYPRLEGYEPTTLVTDHAAIDLDQQAMEDQMNIGNFSQAYNVYTRGGYSRSFAMLELIDLPNDAKIVSETRVLGRAVNGDLVEGMVIETREWGEAGFVQKIPVQYKTYNDPVNYVGCQVGGLYTFHDANRRGCFNDTGVIHLIWPKDQGLDLTVDEYIQRPETVTVQYFYHPRQDNLNARTLQVFSTSAVDRMRPCDTCKYYDDYQTFLDYYGDRDYGDKWIQAAFRSSQTNFKNNRGNADFYPMRSSQEGRQEAIEKGSEYMNVLMYTIREIEDAITDCECYKSGDEDCTDKGLHSLDEAVAFYVGSLEGRGTGHFGYHLANKRARDFKTAGESSDNGHGQAFVNIQVMNEFRRSQGFLKDGQCEFVKAAKESIVNYMKVPLIQSVLRYAYLRQEQEPDARGTERYEAEGATFAAALLPWLHKCSPSDASFLFSQMKVGSDHTDIDFPKLKQTLEANYGCLGTSCIQVGGIWNGFDYEENATPCGYSHEVGASSSSGSGGNDDGGLGAGAAIGITLAVIVALLVGIVYLRGRRRRPRASETSRISGNIAAVSEIS